jgi:hypothetical protein
MNRQVFANTQKGRKLEMVSTLIRPDAPLVAPSPPPPPTPPSALLNEDNFTYRRVSPHRITIDPQYQRAVTASGLRLINKMGAGWDTAKSRTVEISQRADGTLACMDGQHRVLGAIKADVPLIWARVFTGLTLKQEAELFEWFNNKRNTITVEAYTRFRAGVVAGNADALEINAVLTEFRLYPSGTHKGERAATEGWQSIFSIEKLEQAYIRHGATGLRRILELITQSWPDDPVALQALVVSGVTSFLTRYSKRIDELKAWPHVLQTMKKTPLGKVQRRAAEIEVETNAKPGVAFAIAMAYYCDYKRSANRIIPRATDDAE